MSAVPPVSRDALTHHLAVPKLYVENGKILELPEILSSYYPQLLDLFYCIPLIAGNDILPKYIHFLFAILTAMLIYKQIKQRTNRFYASLGILFFLSLPVVIKLSTMAYVDLGLMFFSFAAITLLLRWYKTTFNLKWILLSGICCGLALSTKYNGLITLFLLTIFIPLLYLNHKRSDRNSQFKAGFQCTLFLFVSLLVFSPWLIKNYVWTGNPIFPLFIHSFPADQVHYNKELLESTGMNHFLMRKYVFNETWYETAAIPIRIFFQGMDDNPKYFDGRLNPLLFFLPIFAFLGFNPNESREEKVEKRVLLIFSVLFILFVFFQTDMRIRWIGPAIPPLVVLSVMGLRNIFGLKEKISKLLLSILTMIIITMIGLNFIYLFHLYHEYDPIPYISGKKTRAEYIQERRPEYATLEYANQHLSKDTKILAFFLGDRRYYSNHPMVFNRTLFKKIATNSDNTVALLIALKEKGITDLILNYSKFNHWVATDFTIHEKTVVNAFFKQHTKKMFAKDDHGLYHIIGEAPLN